VRVWVELVHLTSWDQLRVVSLLSYWACMASTIGLLSSYQVVLLHLIEVFNHLPNILTTSIRFIHVGVHIQGGWVILKLLESRSEWVVLTLSLAFEVLLDRWDELCLDR